MTTATTTVGPDGRAMIDYRLDAIERVLFAAGVGRAERRSVVEEVEGQIWDMLGRRGDGDPTERDVRAVLAELDPPEAYAPPEALRRARGAGWDKPPRPRRPRPSALAVASAATPAVLVFGWAALIAASELGVLGDVGAAFAILVYAATALAALASTACGAVAVWQIRTSEGWLYGMPLAVVGALFFPLILGNLALGYVVLLLDEVGIYGFIGLSLLAADGALGTLAWRLLSRGYAKVPSGPAD